VQEESYVVRIYRRGRAVVGVVEAVRTGWQKPFQSVQQLADILAKPGGRRKSASRDGEAGTDVEGEGAGGEGT
jgi:hypothetical protein